MLVTDEPVAEGALLSDGGNFGQTVYHTRRTTRRFEPPVYGANGAHDYRQSDRVTRGQLGPGDSGFLRAWRLLNGQPPLGRCMTKLVLTTPNDRVYVGDLLLF